ncbi:MAG: DUF4465 domain-containing protein [Bacteroidales bacterium]
MKKYLFFTVFAAGIMFLNSSCKKDEIERDKITFEEIALNSDGVYIGEDMNKSYRSGNAIFNIDYNPEWQSWSGFAVSNHTDTETRGLENQFSAIAGSGANGSDNYAVLYTWDSDTIEFIIPEKITNISICNTTWAYYAMLEGDPPAKQFGGNSGDESDYFNLNMTGLNESGQKVLEATLTLADYRFTNNAEDYIANQWTDIDLSEAGFLKYLVFSFESSDVGDFGINTPTFVCIDNIFGELQE